MCEHYSMCISSIVVNTNVNNHELKNANVNSWNGSVKYLVKISI